MKAIWSGSISFGLVNIPIKMYSAISPENPGFTLLCSKCHTPIHYQRWCERCNKKVTWQETVKGLKQKDGSYFILTQENLKKLKPEKTELFVITEFIDTEQIHPIYFENHFYAAPSKKNEKEYFLFLAALNRSNKAAVGTFVIHEKEHVAALTAYENTILVNTLNYAYEVKDTKQVPYLAQKHTFSKDELKLAQTLIEKLTNKTFKIEKYKNKFKERLEKAIKEGKKVKPKKGAAKKITKKVSVPSESIMSKLKASLKIKRPSTQPVARAKSRS